MSLPNANPLLRPSTHGTELYLAVRGWQAPVLAAGFYPEDLPPEWRPDYYATQLRAVVLPEAEWRAQDPEEWAEALPRLLWALELCPDAEGLAALRRWRAAGLEPHAIHLLPAAAVAADLAPLDGLPLYGEVPPPGLAVAAPWHPGRSTSGAFGTLRCAGALPDLRRLRAWLEEFLGTSGGVEAALLLLEGDALQLSWLEQARILAEHLG